MRAHGRTDSNQTDLVKAMRDAGMTVQVLSNVGGGCPDTLVGFRGVNILIEIKDGEKVPSKQELTADEREWHATWGGQCCVATSAEEAVTAVIAAVKALERV